MNKQGTNSTLYVVAKQDGTKIPFIGTDIPSARKKALELAGVGYRYLSIVSEHNPDFVKYRAELGL